MLNLAELKKQNPSLAAMSDMDIVMQVSKGTGISPSRIAARMGLDTEAFYHDPERNPLSAGLASGVDQFQGLMGSAGAAAADAFGWDSGRDAMNRYAKDQMIESQFSGRPDLERVEDQSLGSALPFLGYQVSKQVPNIAAAMAAMLSPIPGDEAAVLGTLGRGLASAPKALGGGGLEAGASFAGRRAALEAGQGLAKDVYRSTAAMYPLGVGSLYQESVDAGDPSPYAALAGGVPYGMAESVLPAWLKGTLGTAGEKFAGNLLQRMGKAGALAATGEAGVELFQNELEMGFNPTLTDEDIASRRLNSAVIGGLVGGSLGSLGGLRSSAPVDLLARPDEPAPGYNISQNIFTPDTSVQDIINQNVGLTAGAGHSRKDVSSAFNAPLSAPIWAADFDGNPILLRTEGDLYNFEHFGPSGIRSHIESAVDRDRAQFTDLANQNQARIDAMYAEPPSGSVRFHQAAGLTASRPPAPIPQSIHADAINAGVPISGYEQVESYDADILSSSDASRLGIPQTGGRAPLSTPMVTTGNIMGGRAPNIAAGIAAMQEGTNETTEMAAPGSQVPGVDPTGSGAGGAAGGVGQRAEGSDGTAGAQPGAGTVVPVGDALPASAALTKYAITSTAKSVKSLAASMDEHLRSGTISDAEFDGLMLRLSQAQFVPKQREALAKEFSRLVIERMTGKPNTIAAPAPVRLQDEQKQPGDVVTWTAQQIAENNLALSGQQQTAMDVLNDAAKTGDLDQFIDAEGAFILPALAKATGISPGALKVQLTRVKDKIEKSTGTSMVEALRQRERKIRKVEAPDESRLGSSPSEQRIVVDEAEIFGTEDGGEQSMSIINSLGGSQSETSAGATVHAVNSMIEDAQDALAAARRQANKLRRGSEQRVAADRAVELAAEKLAVLERRDAKNKQQLEAAVRAIPDKIVDATAMAAAEPNPVADARAAEAMARRDAMMDMALARPEAEIALEDWDDMRSDGAPSAAELTRQDAYEHLMNMMEFKNGQITEEQYIADQRDIERRYDAGAPRSLADARSDGQTGQRLGSENGRQDQAPARLEAPVATERPSESDRQPVESAPTEAVDPDADLMDALQRIAAKKDGKNSKIATSYIREAMLAQTEEEGAEVRRRAGEWANAVLGEEPGVGKFSQAEATTGQPATTLREKLLKAFAAPYFFDRRVVVVQSQSDLPPDVAQSAKGKKVLGFFENKTQKVYLIADNIAEGTELSVLLHEVGVHAGMRNLLGTANYDALVGQLKRWLEVGGDTVEGRLAIKAYMRMKKAEGHTPGQAMNARQSEELLAYFVEEAVKAGIDPTAVSTQPESLRAWFRRLWAAVKVAIRKLNLNPDTLTAQGVVDLAYGAARMELNAAWHGTAADFRKFDHRYMGTGEGAQAYGWGTYLAQAVGIGKAYWQADVGRKGFNPNALVGDQLNFDFIDPPTGEVFAPAGTLIVSGGKSKSPYDAMANIARGEINVGDVLDFAAYAGFDVIETRDPYRHTTRAVKISKPDGNLMRVDTAIQDNELLDWDKPLSEQSEGVRAGIFKGMRDVGLSDGHAKVPRLTVSVRRTAPDGRTSEGAGARVEYQTGKQLYELLQGKLKSDKAASEYLDSIGIKGIKFLDANSRNMHKPEVYETDIKLVAGVLSGPHKGWRITYLRDGTAVVTDGKRTEAVDDKDFVGTIGGESAWGVKYVDKHGEVLEKVFDTKGEADAFAANQAPQPTRNIVVFNDKNIQRVFSEKGADPESRMFSIADDAQPTDALLKATTFDRLSEVVPMFKRLGLRWMTMHQLADQFKDMKSVRKFTDTIVAMGSRAKRIQLEYANVQDRMVELPKVQQQLLYQAMIKSTMAGEDLTDGLSTEAKAVYTDARDLFRKNWEARRALLAAKGVTDLPTLKGPYFPLMRFGKYIVAWKSQALKDAEARGATKEVEALKAEDKHYKVAFFDQLATAERQGQTWGGVTPVLREEYVRNATPVNASFLKQVEAELKAKLGDTEDVKAIVRSVQDLYAASLPDVSALKRQMKRLNVAGVKPEEMMRAFSLAGIGDAFHIARLEQADTLTEALYEAKGESRDKGTHDAMALYNTVREKYGLLMSRQEPTPIIDALRNLTYLSALGSSPAFVAINATQPWLVTLPMLAGRYGHRRSAGELKRALGQASQLVYGLLTSKGARYELDFDTAEAKRLFPDERERSMLKSMLERGQIDITIGTDLASEATGGSWAGRMMRWFTFMPHQIETVNRISTALTAYRLASGDTKRFGDAAEIEAQKYAYKMLYDTQIDYSNEASAVMMDTGKWGGIGKLVFQFRKYQQGMVYLLASQAKGWAQGDKEARNALFSMLALSFVASGAAGNPLSMPIGMLAAIFASAWPDDDEPEPEVMWRQFLTDTFGEEGGLVAAKGFPALFGSDISQRVGLGNVLNPVPFAEWRGSVKDSLAEFMAFGAAPALGTIGKFGRGLDALDSHEYAKAASLFAPKILADAVKGFQLAHDGIKTSYGNTAIEPEQFSATDVLLQGLGITPTQKTEYWDRRGIVSDKNQAIKDARNKLIAEYLSAKKQGDTADAQEAIDEFNQRHPAKPYRIDRSSLLKSEAQKKRTLRTEGGIDYRKGEEWKAEMTTW